MSLKLDKYYHKISVFLVFGSFINKQGYVKGHTTGVMFYIMLKTNLVYLLKKVGHKSPISLPWVELHLYKEGKSDPLSGSIISLADIIQQAL